MRCSAAFTPAICFATAGADPRGHVFLGDLMNGTSGRNPALVTIGCCLLFLACAVQYAIAQNLWIDESTQLSGATLSVGRLIAWLTGTREPAFGVPMDRMPPISYLIDAACYRTFCVAPLGYRLLHLAFATAGLAVATWTVARRYGVVPGLVTGLMLALSPKLTELGVEIRAYPIFFAITCVQIAMLFRLIEARRLTPGALGLFLLLGLAAGYTHFFGLVSSMALFTGLFVARATTLREAAGIAGTAVLLVVLCAGLAPFIMTASAISGVENVGSGSQAIITYFLRLAGHSANVVSPVGMVLFLLPLAGLVAIGAVRIARGFGEQGIAYRRDPAVALAAALVSGITVTLLAFFVAKGFNPLKPTYSLWVLPMLATFLGTICASRGEKAGWTTRVARGLALVMLLGAATGEAMIVRHSGWFVHGPSSAIRAAVGDRPVETAVVYEGGWAYGFFPTFYHYHQSLDQWLIAPDGQWLKIGVGGDPVPADPAALAAKRRIVLVRITLRDYHDLRVLRARGPDGVGEGAGPLTLPTDQPPFDHLSATTRTTQPGLYQAEIASFERTLR